MAASEKTLSKLGFIALGMINDNLENMIDYEGKKFEPYSLAYWIRKKYKKKSRAKTRKARTKAYLRAVAAWEGKKNKVTMTDTGAMLSALTVIETNSENGTITIGFNTTEAAEIAYYHNVSGAGKSRVLRKFLGLSESQKTSLMQQAGLLLLKDQVFIRGLHEELKSKI